MSTQAIAISTKARQRYLLALLFAGFSLTGLEITLAGPLLPTFISRWSLSDSRAGIFFTLQYSCSLAGVWLASLITHYLGNRFALLLGYLVMGAGLATANSPDLHVAMFALALLGIGYGLVVPPTNLEVAGIGGARGAALVSLVNFAWGTGSFACPFLVLLALKNQILTRMLFAFGVFGWLLSAGFIFAEFPESKRGGKKPESAAGQTQAGLTATTILAAGFFLYVLIETSFGGWAAAHAKRLSGTASGVSILAPMFFYGGLMAGRAFAPFVLARVQEFRLVLCALGVAIAGGTCFLLARSQNEAFLFVAVTGIGCAVIFPVYVTWLSRWYGPSASKMRGLMFSMASVGSAAGPGLVGFVSQHAGGLRAGLLVPLVAAVIMGFLLLGVRRQATA
ncbi:MAG TPA: hypothetical protein VJN93_12430 [Candidatus Acidoferrum sp.]|nr:hypothetical protein [Candidatus Acidoferrum sp.]